MDRALEKEIFKASSYSKNQARLFKHQIAELFFTTVVELARVHDWVSNEHFSMDGTLIEPASNSGHDPLLRKKAGRDKIAVGQSLYPTNRDTPV